MHATGYRNGKAFPVEIELVDGVWMTRRMAVAWLAMRMAAAHDGVVLVPTEGFRTNEEQARFWEARQTEEAQRRYGIAARPGFSRHQSGDAVDITTFLTAPMFAAGKRSKIFDWLEANAARFGFVRTIKSEPWHWELKA